MSESTNLPQPATEAAVRPYVAKIPAEMEDEWQLFKSRAARDARLSIWSENGLRSLFLRLKFEDEYG